MILSVYQELYTIIWTYNTPFALAIYVTLAMIICGNIFWCLKLFNSPVGYEKWSIYWCDDLPIENTDFQFATLNNQRINPNILLVPNNLTLKSLRPTYVLQINYKPLSLLVNFQRFPCLWWHPEPSSWNTPW